MGKGYNNYMCKKPFHPGSKANIKRAWMAEQKTENDKRKQDELKVQYEKEQNLYNNRALISSESKDKLELNFMYEAPPGAKRERQKEDDEPEYKFEWQRKYNAPREDYAKGNEDIKDQPFGIPVRNVRCIKCHKWGHINTDRECPLFNQASSSSMPTTSMDPLELMKQMREDGFGLKEHVLGHQLNPAAANQQFIQSDESDPEMDFLKSLSTAEKKKLLRKLKNLSKKQKKGTNCKKKKSKKTKKKSKAKSSSSSESEEEINLKKKKRRKKKSSSSESGSSSSSSNENDKIKKKKENKYSKDKKSKIKKDKNQNDTDDYKSSKSKFSDHEVTFEEEKSSKKSTKNTEQNKMKDSKSKVDSSKNILETEKHKDILDTDVSPKPTRSKSNQADTPDQKEKQSSCFEEREIKTEILTPEDNVCEDYIESSRKRKINEEFETEKCDESDAKKTKCDHPDGFSHLYPQAHVKENYIFSEEEYKGKIHDRFRHFNRDKRSPSVKQKYNY